MKANFSPAQEIQICFPQEPIWGGVPEGVLVELVQTHFQEPSCATLALGELRARKSAQATNLAEWLLQQEDADQWLKAAAADTLAGD